jgi:tol-pal system protein YbgF
MHSFAIKILVLSLALSGVAMAAPSKSELDRRLQGVESGQGDLQSRLGKLERSSSTEVMLELLQKVDQLQQENAQLQGSVEEQQNEIERLRKRQRDLYLDVDRRLNDLQLSNNALPQGLSNTGTGVSAANAATAVGPAASTTEEPAPASVVLAPVAVADPAEERVEYENAFNSLREGKHGDSIAAFKRYLKSYPKGRFAHNAQYWMGEANYVTRNFDQALRDFQSVLDNYPSSNKIPDASLKLGYTHYELKDFAKARKSLAAVVKNFPTSKAASLAEKRLLSMGKDGI